MNIHTARVAQEVLFKRYISQVDAILEMGNASTCRLRKTDPPGGGNRFGTRIIGKIYWCQVYKKIDIP